eukprot:1392626-Amorphochlora_amoeboformis.AAC.1
MSNNTYSVIYKYIYIPEYIRSNIKNNQIKNSGHDDVSEKDALEVAKVIAEFEARGLDPDSSDLPIEDVDELDESDDQTMLAE